MLIRFIVRLLGGFWKLRQRIANKGLFAKIYSMIYNQYQQGCGAGIPIQTKFAGAPVFPHHIYGVFISGEARIGIDCVIFHQVTIGSNTLPDSKGCGAPIIGDNCYIGSGAKIIGKVVLGNNVRVGANAVVTQDVPDNSVVVGNNTIITKKQLNNTYYTYKKTWMEYHLGKWSPVQDVLVLERLKNLKN